MPYDPLKHHRRSIRLPGYNYANAGAYFVTICAQVRHTWFGVVQDGHMELNVAGEAVWQLWHDLPDRFPFLALDQAMLMPDHFYALLWITVDGSAQSKPAQLAGTAPGSLARCIQAFKSLSTNTYIPGVRESGWEAFDQRLWQRNYYERIVRQNEEEAIRDYILANPQRWHDRQVGR